MRLAKTIDELYTEIVSNGCDFVVTTDVSLATALNRRIDKPIIGEFAKTPLNIATEVAQDILGHEPMNDIELVRSISKATGYDIRFIHGEIDNIRDIRRHSADVRKHLSHTRKSLDILNNYIEMPTIE